MKNKIDKANLSDIVLHVLIPKKILPKISKDIAYSTLLVILGILVSIGTNYLTVIIGGDAAQKYFQELTKNLFSTLSSFSLVIPMTVVAILSSLLSVLKILIEFTERKKSSDVDKSDFDLRSDPPKDRA